MTANLEQTVSFTNLAGQAETVTLPSPHWSGRWGAESSDRPGYGTDGYTDLSALFVLGDTGRHLGQYVQDNAAGLPNDPAPTTYYRELDGSDWESVLAEAGKLAAA